MQCVENVSCMPQKDIFLFILTKHNLKSGFEGKLTSHKSHMVDGIVSADIFHIFSESDHHYFFKKEVQFWL